MNDTPYRQSPAAVLGEIGHVFVRRRGLAIAIFLVVVLATVGIAALKRPTYKAEMKFLVRNARSDVMMTADGGRRVMAPDISESEVNTEIELLNSRDLFQTVAATTMLARGEGADPTAVAQAVEALKGSLTITPVRKTSIIAVTYESTDAAKALATLKTFSTQYLDKHVLVHHTPGAYKFFQSQSERYAQQLQDSRAALSGFHQANGIVSLDEQKQIAARKLSDADTAMSEVNASINEARRRAASLGTKLATMEPRILGETRSMPNQYSTERLTTMLAELQNRRTTLLTKFAPGDRLIKEIDQQVIDTTAALGRTAGTPAEERAMTPNPLWQNLRADLTKAEADVAGLDARRAVMLAERAGSLQYTTRLEEVTPEQGRLARAVQVAEENVRLYDTKLEEARIADALDREKITNVTVAQAPVVPANPSSKRELILAAGFLLAIVSGLGAALTAEYFGVSVSQAAPAAGWRPSRQPAHQPLASNSVELANRTR